MKNLKLQLDNLSINITSLLVVVIIIGAFFLGSLVTKVQYLEKGGNAAPATAQANDQPVGTPTPPPRVTMDVGHFPIKGNKDAKVTIVEFADFRCPFCEQLYNTTLKQIIKDYVDTGKAKFAFRQYAFLGPASTTAANAAECANDQGKFWEMHDYLYGNQPPETDTSMYTTDNLTSIAQKLGLNTTQFRSCLEANKFSKNVTDDFNAGQAGGVTGTPATFINGLIISGAQPYSVFQSLIDQELAK